jgi:uncharacterized protein (TIGR04255 family)
MLNLPPADHTPLRHPPLPLVVAQARFATQAGNELSSEVTARFQASLVEAGYDFNQVTPVQTNEIVFGPGVPPSASVSASGFQFSPEDRSWMVTLMADSVSLETPSFLSFNAQFGPLLKQVLAAATLAVSPISVTRVGLRFVNLLRSPDGLNDWGRWLRPTLVAPHIDELLRSGVLNHNQQLILDVAPQVRSAVRTGPAMHENQDAFLLDIDTFAEPAALWTSDTVSGWFGQLNESGVALFQALVSAEMLAYLKYGDDGEAGTR